MDTAHPAVRPLADILADTAAAERQLADLETERRLTRLMRRAGIVIDFDAGLSRTAIAAKWGVPYGHVAAILHKARRTERTRRAIGLELPQKADYDRMVRAGVHTRLARLIALRNQS